jgi:hypothetical protein
MSDRELAPDSRTPYRDAYRQEVEQAMGEGFSLTAFAGFIGVSRAAVDGWIAAYPEFAEAVGRAKARRLMRWERAALDLVERGGAGASSVILFGLKTMGTEDWTDGDGPEAAADGGASVVIFALPENGRT